jgi:hypothetical protein
MKRKHRVVILKDFKLLIQLERAFWSCSVLGKCSLQLTMILLKSWFISPMTNKVVDGDCILFRLSSLFFMFPSPLLISIFGILKLSVHRGKSNDKTYRDELFGVRRCRTSISGVITQIGIGRHHSIFKNFNSK